MKLILEASYLCAAICAYLLFRRFFRKDFEHYTTGDRILCLVLSSLGFASLVAALILLGLQALDHFDKPARW
jgi:hypothetical protein